MSRVRKLCLLLLLFLSLAAGRDWLRLAWQAFNYPVAAAKAFGQSVTQTQFAYVAAGADGIQTINLADSKTRAAAAPVAPADRIDDLALADGLLFALDATPPGYLLVYSLADPRRPRLLEKPLPVEVGPFSGVSAAAGVVAVSGGTSRLSLRHYAADGRLGMQPVFADYGRGQPDIALRDDGRLAAISTHLYGPKFAVTVARIDPASLALTSLGQLELPGAGFTAGGFKPAHFPLVARWLGDRLYVAHGGGLDVVAASDHDTPRLLAHDDRAAPAMDLIVQGRQLFVLRAGAEPALLRYALDAPGRPQRLTVQRLPANAHPAALVVRDQQVFLIDQRNGWQPLATDALASSAATRKQPSHGDIR